MYIVSFDIWKEAKDRSIHTASIIDVLLSAGKEIHLWQLENEKWHRICNKKPATDILLAKFEPKSNTFATVGKVKLIRLTKKGWLLLTEYIFVLLSLTD